ncbi:uncharacterized protein LOC132307201 isoform X2 [Cornus florida]|uniref:uncharacterized protein LOC132307201 isoform X2 n=1 Tax=Cornus florida TaxID=4283 RepID=UPI00289FAA1E|nr:uncharacterized protein LOC132307201 isoform X2 [Cornus florida]
MKFLSSSSSSASSTITTTTTTTGSNICNSKGANTTSCLSGVLRRLLCFNSLPTYPSDQIKDPEVTSVELSEYDHKLQFSETEEKVGDTATPGVVARLMGLESMPRIDLANTQSTPSSISRCRSMNSVDSSKEFESRLVKTSLSFRETPTFLELDEFFVLSFENGGESKKLGLKSKKSDMGFREMKSRKTESNRRQSVYEKNDTENKETNKVVSDEKLSRRINHKPSKKVGNNGKVIDSSNVLRPRKNSNGNSHVAMEVANQSKPMNHHGNSDGVKSMKKKKKKKQKENVSVAKKAQTECDSENSSPVSVLDFVEFIADPKVPISAEDSRLTDSNSRRKLSELENSEHSPPCSTNSSVSNDEEAKKFGGKVHGSMKKDQQSENYAELWCEICKMAEQELKETKWEYREMWKLQDFEEDKVADFGFQIFEELLNELVDQLAATSNEKILGL